MKPIQNIKSIAVLLLILITTYCCSDEDNQIPTVPFVVAFETLSTNLTSFDSQNNVLLSYSKPTNQVGTISISISETNAIYGVDYTTTPAAVNNELILDISENESQNSFIFKKLNPTIDEDTSIQFEITDIGYANGKVQGNSAFEFNSSASLGGSLKPNTGGPNQQDQIFVDLSNNKLTASKRDSWDLGFSNGDSFRVTLNGSIYMFAAALSTTDIDTVTDSNSQISELQPMMTIGQVGSNIYADDPTGDLNKTSITEISTINENNPVYLINMGYAVGTDTPETGSVNISGDPRGWKKIRILRDGNTYTLQYANLNDTAHQEVTITKNASYNFTFFSMVNNNIVNVQPERQKWDLGFTVFTNVISFDGPSGAYGFSDFIITNRPDNVKSYSFDATTLDYDEFSLSDVDYSSLNIEQNSIGSTWRNVFSGAVTPDIFYILKDADDNIYKIKFLALTDDFGIRGYPEFEYELLQ